MSRGTSHPWKSLVFRRSNVAISLLALVIQVSSAGHPLFVEHVPCAEHGHLIHGSAHHGDNVWGPLIEAQAVRPTSNSDGSSGCEHCGIAVERKDTAAPHAPFELSDTPRLADATPAPVSVTIVLSGPLRFRVAPKNSPPA